MSRNQIVGLAAGSALAFGASFMAGRYAAPAKVITKTETKTETVVQWRDREVVHTVAGPVRIVTVQRDAPAAPAGKPGCDPCPAVHETIVTEDRGSTVTDRATVARGSETQAQDTRGSRVEISDRPRLSIAVLAVAPVDGLARAIKGQGVGAEGVVGYRILGPVSVVGKVEGGAGQGVRVGVGLGVTF